MWTKGANCDQRLPSPRIYVYDSKQMPPWLQKTPAWRNTAALVDWIKTSPYLEANGNCADYFMVPSYPDHDGTPFHGDAFVGRLFEHIRTRWPYWNRTVQAREARHFWMLPCDHGPGDCAYSRPTTPHKYSFGSDAFRAGTARARADSSYLTSTWGSDWEFVNPASSARLLFFLTYNGWTDGLRNPTGFCRNCFQPGLDIRLPTPESHECGPLCGLHHGPDGKYLSYMLQRELLAAAAVVGRRTGGTRRASSRLERGKRNCTIFWAGAIRGRNNPDRNTIVDQVSGAPGACVRNTLTSKGNVPIPQAMKDAHYCYSPRGWDQGDSDRYLPALLYGCVPIMSDRLEALPYQELPEMRWNETTLYVDTPHVAQLPALLANIPPEAEARMVQRAART